MHLGGGELLNGDVTNGGTSQGHMFKPPGMMYCLFLLTMTIKLRCCEHLCMCHVHMTHDGCQLERGPCPEPIRRRRAPRASGPRPRDPRTTPRARSEDRRVGKERRSRWAPHA